MGSKHLEANALFADLTVAMGESKLKGYMALAKKCGQHDIRKVPGICFYSLNHLKLRIFAVLLSPRQRPFLFFVCTRKWGEVIEK